MKKRPLAVTIVSWYLIVSGIISLIAIPFSLKSQATQNVLTNTPVPIGLQYAIMFTGLVVLIVCGSAMLKGYNWGRVLYIIWQLLALAYTVKTSPIRAAVIPGSIIYIIVVFCIINVKANDYFSSKEIEIDAENN